MLLVKETKHFAFGDTDFKLVMKEKKTDKLWLPLPFPPWEIQMENLLQEGNLNKITLALERRSKQEPDD